MIERIKQLTLNELTVFITIWIVLLILPFLGNEQEAFRQMTIFYVAVRANLIVLSIINNYWLLPKLIREGKYGFYIFSIVVAIALFSLNEELLLEQLMDEGAKYAGWSIQGFYFAMFRSAFIVLVFSCYKFLWDYQNKISRIKTLEKENVESELKFLKSQINPHVLFNNLNNIYSLALDQSEQVPKMILKLSQLMRYMLYDSNEQHVPLEKEIEYLRDFIALQKLRLEDSALITLHIEGNPAHKKIPPLLLITFVENSFKHSMKTTDKHVEIIIRLEIKGNKLHFHTANTYSATDDDHTGGKRGGIGLKNVTKRLDLIYDDNYQLKFYPNTEYYHVTLEIELESELTPLKH